jgi:hypothetical protein
LSAPVLAPGKGEGIEAAAGRVYPSEMIQMSEALKTKFQRRLTPALSASGAAAVTKSTIKTGGK